jgi:Xaa-Pro aminopeptidase
VVRLIECLEAMEAADLDALVLGRDAHVRAVTGEARLWLAGTRPYAANCIVVRSAQSAHVPPIMWNADHLADVLRSLQGFPTARRIGVDGMTPAARTLLASVVPEAVVVDATPMLRELLRVKTRTEISELRAAAAIAVDAFNEARRGLVDGATAAQLVGRFAQAAAAHAVTVPAFEAITSRPGANSWWPVDGPISLDAPITMRAGVLREGWEASLARTYQAGEELVPPHWSSIVAACRPGAQVGELFITHAIGRGIEVLDDDVVLEPGMVVAVELEAGGALRQDVLLVRDDGPELLTG